MLNFDTHFGVGGVKLWNAY